MYLSGKYATMDILAATKQRWQKFKAWWTIDHVVDLAVDMLLLFWEVISSPVLIIVRIIRHFIGEWIIENIKALLRWIVHWFTRKRAYRLEHGHGIFRTYWFLILPSPFMLLLLMMLTGISIGIAEDFDVMLELLIRGCSGPEDGYWCNIS
jgi:hypothetical protein|tara:strand:+ start:125 stop:577 length:453 start_codon:yes stop_codon:yes gene_type:complete